MNQPLSNRSPGSPLSRAVPFLVIGFLNALLYYKSLAFAFTELDDLPLVNAAKSVPAGLAGAFSVFTRVLIPGGMEYFYRPLLMLSLVADERLQHVFPFSFHGTNLLIHLLASCLVYVLLRKLLQHGETAFFLAALFSVHPALTPAVAWVPGRNDSLLALFVLGSFISFIEFLRTSRQRHLWTHLACFAAALFTKESAAAALPLFLLYRRLFERERAGGDRAVWAGWAALLLLWGSLKLTAAGSALPETGAALASFIGALPSLVQYLGKAFIPVHLSNYATVADTPLAYGAAATAGLLGALAASRRLKDPLVLFGAAWFALFLLPTFFVRTELALEHRLYLPLAGVLVMAGRVVVPGALPLRLRRAAGIALVALFSVITFAYQDVFSGPLPFWRHAAATSPGHPRAHTNLGCCYVKMHLLPEALEEFEKAYALRALSPAEHVDSAMNLASTYYLMGDIPRAEQVLTGSMAARTRERGRLHYFYAQLCRRLRRPALAEEHLKKAVRADPYCADYYRELVSLLAEQKRARAAGIYRSLLLERWRREKARVRFLDPAAGEWLRGEARREALP